jgi:hypothetical protein
VIAHSRKLTRYASRNDATFLKRGRIMKIEAHRKILLVAILTLLFIPLLANTVHSDSSLSEFKLTAGIHAAEFDQFGYAVDISGDWAVVGAPNGESVYL